MLIERELRFESTFVDVDVHQLGSEVNTKMAEWIWIWKSKS
jgi:hypothetical protein